MDGIIYCVEKTLTGGFFTGSRSARQLKYVRLPATTNVLHQQNEACLISCLCVDRSTSSADRCTAQQLAGPRGCTHNIPELILQISV